jgi:hypothetical protein
VQHNESPLSWQSFSLQEQLAVQQHSLLWKPSLMDQLAAQQPFLSSSLPSWQMAWRYYPRAGRALHMQKECLL